MSLMWTAANQEEEDDYILQTVLGTGTRDETVDSEPVDWSEPPLDGMEYLRKVKQEAQNIVYSSATFNRPKQKSPQAEEEQRSEENCAFRPKEDWVQRQVKAFSKLRISVARHMAQQAKEAEHNDDLAKKKSGLKLPGKKDKRGWYIFLYGAEKWNILTSRNLSDKEDSKNTKECKHVDVTENIARGHPPLLSLVSQLSPSLCVILFEFHLEWIEDWEEIPPEMGPWIYTLLARLEKPLYPDVTSSLRSMSRIAKQQRADILDRKTQSKEDERAVITLTLFICLVAKYFAQRDLADQTIRMIAAENEKELAFRRFRPYCSALVVQPRKETLEKLDRLFNLSDPTELYEVQDYLLFPMQVYLKNPVLPENYTILVLEVLDRFCKRTPLNLLFPLKDVLNNVLVLLTQNEQGPSEDLKIAALNCISSMISSAEDDVLEQFYSDEMKLPLSHLIFTAVTYLEKDRALQNVLQASLDLISTCLPSNECAAVATRFVTTFSQILPGLSTGLVKLLKDTSPSVQARTKAKTAMVWTGYICTILADERIKCHDEVWLNKAKDHVFMQMQILLSLCSSQKLLEHERLATALLETVCRLISQCSTSLDNLIQIELEMLACLSVTDNSQAASVSKDALHALVRSPSAQIIQREINSASQEKIFNVCQSLYLLRNRRGNEGIYEKEYIEDLLAQLQGQIIILKETESVSTFFYSDTYLHELLKGLLVVSRLEEKSPIFGDIDGSESTLGDFRFEALFQTNAVLNTRPKKSYKYLNSISLQRRFSAILCTLSECANLSSVVDYLLQSSSESTEVMYFDEREVILIINEIIQVASEDTLCPSLLETLSEAYLYSKRLRMESSLGLPETLVRVIADSDSSNCHEAHVMYATLSNLAQATGHAYISSLLSSHIDFMARNLNLALRHLATGPSNHTLFIQDSGLETQLRIVLTLKNVQDSPGLKDTLDALLLQLDFSWTDSSPERTVKILNKVLIFIESFKEESKKTEKPKEPIGYHHDRNLEKGGMTKFVLAMKEADDLIDAEIDEDPACPPEGFHVADQDEKVPDSTPFPESDSEEKVITERVELLRNVIEHCRHFISMVKRPQWQILALNIVARSALLLQMDKDELLPLIHLSWQPLEVLFASENLFIVERAFWCLRVFARVSRDFIQRRTLTKVFPTVIKYIKRLQVVVQDRERHRTLIARQARTVLCGMIRGLWEFLALLELNEIEADQVIQEMLEFVDLKIEGIATADNEFLPARRLDNDILRLKRRSC